MDGLPRALWQYIPYPLLMRDSYSCQIVSKCLRAPPLMAVAVGLTGRIDESTRRSHVWYISVRSWAPSLQDCPPPHNSIVYIGVYTSGANMVQCQITRTRKRRLRICTYGYVKLDRRRVARISGGMISGRPLSANWAGDGRLKVGTKNDRDLMGPSSTR